jgi:hypothetical protein
MDPQQFQHGVAEEEATIGGALPGMRIGCSFGQAESHELICFRRTNRGTDEHVIERNRHELSLAYSTYSSRKPAPHDWATHG